MAVAAPADVGIALGRSITDPDEEAQINYWLEAVELIVSSRLGSVALLDQNVLRYVEVEAVVAKMQNPNGYQSETIDDYTYRFGSESRRITILDEWWRLLSPSGGDGAFTITPYSNNIGQPYPDWWHDQ